MPEVKEGESKEEYVSRCISYCIKNEGLSKEAAAGKCYGMWKEKHSQQDNPKVVSDIDNKQSFMSRCVPHLVLRGYTQDEAKYTCNGIWEEVADRPPGDNIEPEKPPGGARDPQGGGGRNAAEQPERILFSFQCEDIQPLKTKTNLDKKEQVDPIKDDFKAVCVYGDRFYKGKFLPMKELEKSYKSLDFSYHDINHWGTTYLDGNPNIEYIVGYQDNVKLDQTTKALTADIHVLKSTEKYQLWRGFVDINQKINKTPNVSVSFYSSKKTMKASEVQGVDFASHGLRGDDDIEYLYDIDFQALSTVFKGACSDQDGCGIQKQCHQPKPSESMKMINEKQILEEKINRLKGRKE